MFFILPTTILWLQLISLAGSMPGGYGAPENITITFLNSKTVKVSWVGTLENVDKYDISHKPSGSNYRVVTTVARNSDAVTLSDLKPDTQYQLSITAVKSGHKFKSRPIVFRTLEPSTSPQDPMAVIGNTTTTKSTTTTTTLSSALIYTTINTNNNYNAEFSSSSSSSAQDFNASVEYPPPNLTVRGVEIGIVLIVLVVWIGAIALFFNRWGKIRMLLPYQPDYKQEQLKVPGTAACAAAVASGNVCAHHTPTTICQQINNNAHQHQQPPRKPRPRMNSAIFVSNSGPGLDPKEFFRRYGSVSRLCRKARSVDNISLEEQHHFGLPTLSISEAPPPEQDEEELEETELNETDHCLP